MNLIKVALSHCFIASAGPPYDVTVSC